MPQEGRDGKGQLGLGAGVYDQAHQWPASVQCLWMRIQRGGQKEEEKEEEAEEEDEKEEEKEKADINKQGEVQELTSYFKQGCHRWPSIRDLQSITRKNKAQED